MSFIMTIQIYYSMRSIHKGLCVWSHLFVCVFVTYKCLLTHLLVKYLCEKGAYCLLIHLNVTRDVC